MRSSILRAASLASFSASLFPLAAGLASFAALASLAGACALHDGVDEINVLLHVGTNLFALLAVTPHLAALGLDAATGIGGALGALHALAHRGPIALDLTAVAVESHAIGIFILDREVIPDFAGAVAQLLPGAHAPAFDRVVAHDPVADVKVVHVLLADMVAAKPDVMVPIADLLFEFGGAVFAAMPDGAAIDPISAQGDDIDNRAVLNAFDGLDVTGLVAAMNSVLRSGPLKQRLPTQFSGTSMWSICWPVLSNTVTPLPVR